MSYRYFDHAGADVLKALHTIETEAEATRKRLEARDAVEGKWLPIARPRWWQSGEVLGALAVSAWLLGGAALVTYLWLTA